MSYPTIARSFPEIILLDDLVLVELNGWNKKHYRHLGYDISNKHIFVEHKDLTGRVKVAVMCPLCEEERSIRWENVVSVGHTYCYRCAKIHDISGQRFGRWLVLGVDKDRSFECEGTSFWWCECECGTVRSVPSSGLVQGTSNSCGCLQRELVSERASRQRGELHPSWQGGPNIFVCEQCGDEFTDKVSSERRFCSASCYGKWVSENLYGESHPLYDPSITDEERGRKSAEYFRWREAIFERDNWTCGACNKRGGTLRAHHLFSYHDNKHLRYELSNGETMCLPCHDEFHSWNGGTHKPCTPDDYYAWLEEIGANVSAR